MKSIVEDRPVVEVSTQGLVSLIKGITHSTNTFFRRVRKATGASRSFLTSLWQTIPQPFARRSKLDKLFHEGFTFPIEKDLQSPATRVMFNNTNHSRRQICLKMWLECNNGVYTTGVYTTGGLIRRTKYLLEGLEFNRHFASDVYLGIVPVIDDNREKKVIQCGPLIREPEHLRMDFNKTYALVMKRLDEDWRLDHQLYPDGLGNEQGMKFLAREIVRMHRQFVVSPIDMGTPKRLSTKLRFNLERFHEALDHVYNDQTHAEFRKRIGNGDMHWFSSLDGLMEQVGKIQQPNYESFEQRHRHKHIRRCHGDLKATNLWICQASNPRSQSQLTDRRLIALDCVDFKPEFCHIDTLSDIAMLAIDLEMRLTSWSSNPQDQRRGKRLTKLFLNTYLHEMGEKETARLLLDYYLIEKAMICTYMSILYDDMPSLGEKYLNVVLIHSQKLAGYLPQKIEKRITRPLVLTKGETIRRG